MINARRMTVPRPRHLPPAQRVAARAVTRSPRRRRGPVVALAIGLVAVAGACTSQPSVKAVAEDIVESIGLEPDEETCMLAALDGYSDAELEAIGEANETVDFSQPNAVETQGSEQLQRFFDDLNRCMGEA